MRLAVIDLGTNTFHLLIVDKTPDGGFKKIIRKRFFIKLAEEGIQVIGKAPFERGLNALQSFKETLDEYKVSFVKAFGTAALRTASNGSEFIHQVLTKTGIEITLIPGDREAELIYKGVIEAVPISSTPELIMDIGGGSVEFIIANHSGILWSQSFPIGVAVLFHRFHHSDPISEKEKEILSQFLEKELAPVFNQLNKYSTSTLIGASGTFDVLENILCKEKQSLIHGNISVKDFHPFYQEIMRSSLAERIASDHIPNTRAEMIIVALFLINYVLSKTSIKNISISAYAMKEGMLKELIENHDF